MDRSSFIGAAASLLAAPRVGPPTTLPPLPPTRKRALVLTGGGARGAYQGGVLAGLAKTGQKFDIVVGTSIGAINGALFSQGDDLGELWHNVSKYHLIKSIPTLRPLLDALAELRDQWRGVISRPYNVLHGAAILYDRGRIFDRTGFFESGPIVEFLADHLDMDRISGSFGWTATNLTASRTESFYIAPREAHYDDPLGVTELHRLDPANTFDRMLYPTAIRASAALPLVFEPVELQMRGMRDPQQYADGGVVANAPIALARHLGATDLVGVGVDPPLKPAPVDSLFGVIFSAFSTNQTRLIFDQLLDASAGPQIASLAVIRPDKELAVGPIDFNKQDELDQAYGIGYADGIAGPRPITLGP